MPTLMSTYTHHEYLTHSAASFGVDRYEDNMFTVRDWQPLSFSSGNLIRGHDTTLHQVSTSWETQTITYLNDGRHVFGKGYCKYVVESQVLKLLLIISCCPVCLANEPMTDDPRKEAVYVAVAATYSYQLCPALSSSSFARE